MALLPQIELGVIITLKQNTVYALPEKWCFMFVETSTPTIKVANNSSISPSVTLTLDANQQVELAGGFIQATSGDVVALFKTFA